MAVAETKKKKTLLAQKKKGSLVNFEMDSSQNLHFLNLADEAGLQLPILWLF